MCNRLGFGSKFDMKYEHLCKRCKKQIDTDPSIVFCDECREEARKELCRIFDEMEEGINRMNDLNTPLHERVQILAKLLRYD